MHVLYEVGSIDTWHETEGCKAKKSWEEKREYIKICRFSCPRIVCEGGGKQFGGRKIGIANTKLSLRPDLGVLRL